MRLPHLARVAALAVIAAFGLPPASTSVTLAADQMKPKVSDEAAAVLLKMGQTLRSDRFSFKADTMRVYADTDETPLHIFHNMTVTVSRPNRLLVDLHGDDGAEKLIYDGKVLTLFSPTANKYTSIPAPTQGASIEVTMDDAMKRFGIDMPLADLLAEAPNKAFLSGVTFGRVVNTVTIDGAEYLHLYFVQPPGIGLELWVEKSDRALPRRLIVTYYKLPDQPNFVAKFSDWNFDIHPTDTDFAFEPPAGATQVPIKAVSETSKK
jgi:hypothetical protein